MAITQVVYDWPDIRPKRQLFHAGGSAKQGGLTRNSVVIMHPEPGGRSWLEMEFPVTDGGAAPNLVSWAISKIANGNVFRIPLSWTPQVCKPSLLGLSPTRAEIYTGVPWDNDEPWDSGYGFRYEPLIEATAASDEGAVVLAADMGTLLNGLGHGHVIGHRDTCYEIDDIIYVGSIATITVMTPLRNAVAVGDLISLRPIGLFTATNPDQFRGLYSPGDLVALGSVRFAEAIL